MRKWDPGFIVNVILWVFVGGIPVARTSWRRDLELLVMLRIPFQLGQFTKCPHDRNGCAQRPNELFSYDVAL